MLNNKLTNVDEVAEQTKVLIDALFDEFKNKTTIESLFDSQRKDDRD